VRLLARLRDADALVHVVRFFADPGVPPSIFGAGEGARYFGLSRANFMFHPNTPLAMEKMRDLAEIVCDITKWEFEFAQCEGGKWAVRNVLRGDPAATRAEAENVGRLSQQFSNVSGAFIDKCRTADYQTTRGILEILERSGNHDDVFAFLNDRQLPGDESLLNTLADEIIHSPYALG
jgi:hypothetical protein